MLKTAIAHSSCPTSIVNAPVEIVWNLLTRPEKWGDFYDVRVTSVEPAGPAVVGQTVFAESGPRLLHLALEFRFTKIDAVNFGLGLDVKLPFGVTVCEDLSCVPIGQDQCRVNYHCGFGFRDGAVWSRACSCVASSTRVRLIRCPACDEPRRNVMTPSARQLT
jgi:hypothetical protein